jgi:hypothetical protein
MEKLLHTKIEPRIPRFYFNENIYLVLLFVPVFPALSRSLKSKLIDQMPATPTKVYTSLLSNASCPPNKAATRSNWKRPTSSQFNAPTITNKSANLSIYQVPPFFFLSDNRKSSATM